MIYNQFFFKAALLNAEFKTYEITFDDFFKSKEIKSFCIDSRSIDKDQLYVALVGQKVDGHDYLAEVLRKGASALIVQKNRKEFVDKLNPELLINKLVIFVEDSFHALKELAKYWRHRFKYPIVGITGSVGKTTTKELLRSIFKEASINAYVSFKNQNTVIGLSLNILNMRVEHRFAVFELGISHKGEMDEIVDVLRPEIGVITYISNAHGQGLGSLKNIKEEKLKIFKFFKSHNIGIVCGDKNFLSDFYYDFPIITFGLKIKNDIQARMIKPYNNFKFKFKLKIYSKKHSVIISSNHYGFINNVLAASSIASLLDVDHKAIVKGIENYNSFEGRFEFRKMFGNRGVLINDSYNASPESMKCALLAYSKIQCKGRKVVVLGDMLELGSKEIMLHKSIGRYLSKNLDLDFVILVGNLSKNIYTTMPAILKNRVKKTKDWSEAKVLLDEYLSKVNAVDNYILFKASRDMKFDKIIKKLS